MDKTKQRRALAALDGFTPEFIARRKTDTITHYALQTVIHGNPYQLIEQLVARIHEQQQTIVSLTDTYCTLPGSSP